MKAKNIIGPIEEVRLPKLSDSLCLARVDTGAKSCAIWASMIREESGILHVIFFGEGHEQYTGQVQTFDHYRVVTIKSSNGMKEKRYKILLSIVLSNRRIRASFTLADRSNLTYPILIGRNVLRSKFIVDVSVPK